MFAAFLVLACLALGVVGLVLPVIPGLIFLALALVLAARAFPSVRARLGRHRRFRRHLDQAERIAQLRPAEKIKIVGWMTVKALLDGLARLEALAAGRRRIGG